MLSHQWGLQDPSFIVFHFEIDIIIIMFGTTLSRRSNIGLTVCTDSVLSLFYFHILVFVICSCMHACTHHYWITNIIQKYRSTLIKSVSICIYISSSIMLIWWVCLKSLRLCYVIVWIFKTLILILWTIYSEISLM